MSTVDFLSKEGVATLWQTIKDYAVANELLAQPSGVATLDEFGKVLQTQLPDYILGQVLFGGTIDGNGVATLTTLFKNRYNLSVATLDVDNLTAANYEGSYFIATANGVSGIAKTLDIVVGDWVISNGSEWTKIDNTDAVRTVLGLKGDIQAPDLRNAMLGKSGNQGSNLALGDIWMGNGDGTVVTHRTSIFARSILVSIAENTMFSKLWADRATNDGNGKNIINTYMPFTGGTFTGDVTHNANLILANSKVIVGKDTSGSNVSLLSLNSSNQVVIAYGAHNKYDTLLYGNKIIAYGDICGQKGVSAKGIADFGLISGSGGGGGTAYTLNIVPSDSKVSIQLKGADGSSDTKEISIFSTSQAGIVAKAPSAGSVLRGNGWGTLAFSELASKPTTLGGYGITDAYTKSQIENGIFPNMRVGLADDLGDIEETLDEEYTFQPTANPNEIRDGYAQIESLKGNSLVWNQRVKAVVGNQFLNISFNKNNVVVSKIKEPVYDYEQCLHISTAIQEGHKGLISFDFYANVGVYGAYYINNLGGIVTIQGKGEATTVQSFFDATQNNVLAVGINHSMAIGTSVEFRNILFIDLTQMFGEGNEPTSVEEFERRCPKGMSMDYNEGEVIHFNGDIKSVGFNQWDEEWEIGSINVSNGANGSSSSIIRTKNYIRVIPSADYYIKAPTNYRIFYYDADKNYIINSPETANKSITMLDNAHYIRLRMSDSYGTTYNNDICINLSDPDKNGTYEPYTEFRRDLPTELFDGGMKGRGTSYDEIYWDKAKRTNVKVQRFGKVDLGTLDYVRYPSTTGYEFEASNLAGAAYRQTTLISDIYTPIGKNTSDAEMSSYPYGMCLGNNSSIIKFYNPQLANSSVSDFKAAMQGVMLYYELAEPIVEEIDIPYMDYQVSNDGTEEIVSDVPTTLIKARVTYNFDTVGTVKQNRFDISTIRSEGVAKLKTPRTIWGQSFDGSGNVSGYAMGLGGAIDFQFQDEINRYGGTLFLQHRGDGSQTGTGSGPTGNIVMCYNGGNVGIGVHNPQYKLDVNGSFKATSGEIDSASPMPLKINSTSVSAVELIFSHKSSNKLGLLWDSNNGVYLYSYVNNKYLGIKDNGTPYFYDNGSKNLLHAGNTKLTLDPAYNWEDKNSQTNKQVYGFTLDVNGTEIGMSAITKEELEAILV